MGMYFNMTCCQLNGPSEVVNIAIMMTFPGKCHGAYDNRIRADEIYRQPSTKIKATHNALLMANGKYSKGCGVRKHYNPMKYFTKALFFNMRTNCEANKRLLH